MQTVKSIDLGCRLGEFDKLIRFPPADYPLKFPIYDITVGTDGVLFIAFYQNNRIASLDIDKNKFLVYPLDIDQPHGIFVHNNILIVSCYRLGCIHLHEVESGSLRVTKSIHIPNFFPISSILYNDLILTIDYFNSKLIAISAKNYSVCSDLSHLLNGAHMPHSIKVSGKFIYIVCQSPQVVVILEGLKFAVAIPVPVRSNGQLMSAIPLDELNICLAINGYGVKEISTNANVISSILELHDATSVQLHGSKLLIASESGVISQVEGF